MGREAGVLRRGRRAAERLMTVTVTVRRATGATTRDPATDADVPVYEDVFTSKCKVQSTDPVPTESEVGERTVVTTRERIDFPWDSPLVQPRDLAHVDAVGPLDDPHLVDSEFRFIAAPLASFKTAHRFPVERFHS